MSELAALGPLTRDLVGNEWRPGGTVFYAARAFAALGADARVAASCAAADRPLLLPALEALGLPVVWHDSRTTAAYSFRYEGERRIMRQDAVGAPWSPEEATAGAGDAHWLHVGGLVRTDFPPDTLEALAAGGRVLLVDAQGLVRTPDLGPLRTDADIGSALAHVTILKLSEEEAETLLGAADPPRLPDLGVAEALLTLGSRGAWVLDRGRTEHVPAAEPEGSLDPTGAGDVFAASYLTARSRGAEPVEAARAASEAVVAVLARD